MSNNRNIPSNTDQSSLDSMARRYKDEMMRLYRMNGSAGGTVMNNVPPQPPQSPVISQRQTTTDSNCRFMTAEEIISGTPDQVAAIPRPLSDYGGDITDGMMNGTAVPYSLAGSGAVNDDTNSRNSSGQTIYVPDNSGMNTAGVSALSASSSDMSDSSDNNSNFRGIIISPSISGTSTASANDLSEIMPSFAFPPDIADGDAVPARINPAYVILGSWFNMTGDNGWGYLQFEVTTGSLGNPVQNATVVVSRIVNNKKVLTRVVKTGASGRTNTLVLPAPAYYPNYGYSWGVNRPFASYSASVYANNYYSVTDINILVEAGVKSVQPVDMIPMPSAPPRPGIHPRSSD